MNLFDINFKWLIDWSDQHLFNDSGYIGTILLLWGRVVLGDDCCVIEPILSLLICIHIFVNDLPNTYICVIKSYSKNEFISIQLFVMTIAKITFIDFAPIFYHCQLKRNIISLHQVLLFHRQGQTKSEFIK